MAKRRLTDQQKRRIASNKNSLSKLKGTADKSADNHIFNGLVVSHHGKKLIVETDDKKQYACKLRQNLGDIACGDNVAIQLDQKNHGVVVAVNKRKNLLEKTGFAGLAKAVAANIGQLVIVCSVEPEPNNYLIDRYLTAAENLPAEALIIINKIDLLNDSNRASIEAIKETYSNIGYHLIETSIKEHIGLEELKAALQNTTSILVGLSGVGKSSLVKMLLPDTDIRIGEISTASKEGKHTTTVSSLYHLPDGGNLIDSPGVRDFTPRNRDKEDIVNGFIELKPYQGYCKFSNCSHTTEPGCAITEALNKGELSQQRVNSFKKMLDDLEQQTR
ncbi:MAG: small ribosomal subunit biogenesis GTPase RsgA [Gammaproteobacteria bacterium]|nr:small ribosomal subunit biogenesis GTPase RsgA [Gammaproteobacteria bacterium]MCW8924267.1 small ribosomal subunit biogenesis GTPase RsgA [Gammaproteobacteria bacterium]